MGVIIEEMCCLAQNTDSLKWLVGSADDRAQQEFRGYTD